MNMQEQLLQILKDATPQAPMAFDEVIQKCNFDKAKVQSALDAMYDKQPYLVNRADVTRSGITRTVYWPTGYVEKATRQHIVINKAYVPPSGHQVRPPFKDKAVKKKEANHMQEKSKIQQILEYIEQNPSCSSPSKLLGITGIDGFVGPYLHKGEVIKTGKGRESKYRLKDGLTALDILNNRKGGTKPPVISSSEIAEAVHEEHVPKFGMGEQASEAAADHTDSPKITFPEPTADWGKVIGFSVGEFEPRVRFAITSEHTLIIQGASEEDIELSAKDTEALLMFIEGIAMTIPTHGYSVGGASL